MNASPISTTRKPNYTVEASEVVVAGHDTQARLMTLAPEQTIPWHYHSEITDHYFVLKGTLTIETRNPNATYTLAAGARHKLLPKTAHLLSNRGAMDCQFLLLQGVGRYDWIEADTGVIAK
jgi:quercetin dioxygenase-like cupin family protein